MGLLEVFKITGRVAVEYSDAQRGIEAVSRSADSTAESVGDLGDEAEATQQSIAGLGDEADRTSESTEELGDETERAGEQTKETNKDFSVWKATLANLASTVIQKAISKVTEFAKEIVGLGKDFTATMSEVKAISGASDEDFQKLTDTAREFGSKTVFSATEAAEALKYMSLAGWDAEQSSAALGGVLDLAAASGEDLGTTSDIVTDAMTAFKMQADEAGHFADVLAVASSNANTNVSMLGESFKYCAPVAGSMGASVEDVSIALGLMANAGIKGSTAGNSLKNSLINLVKPTDQQAIAMEKLGLITTKTVKNIDSEAVAKAQKKVADRIGDLEKKQIAYNQSVEKYGVESAQAQSKLIDIEKAERNLADAQEALTKAQEGTTETVRTGGNVFVDEKGNMKSLSEIMAILRENLGGLEADLIDEEGELRDVDDVIADLSQTEEGLTQAQQLQNAAILFGKQNLSGMLAVINASEEDYNKLTEAVYNSDNAASDMAATMNDNLKGDLAGMNSALEELKLKIYDGLEGPLRNAVQTITGKVVPALTALMQNFDSILPGLAALTTAIVTFKTVMAISGIINTVTTAWTAYKAANEGATVAQWLFNAAVGANPLVLLISLLAALVVGFVVAYKKVDWFREAVDNLASGFVKGWSDFANWWTDKVKETWANIKSVFGKVGSFFVEIWDTIKSKFTAIGTKIGESIGAAFKLAINSVIATVEKQINFIPNAINGAIDLINKLPNVEISAIPTVNLPRLAKGGVVNEDTVVEVGENGSEAIVPLKNNTEWTSEVASLINARIPNRNTDILAKLDEIISIMKSIIGEHGNINFTLQIDNFNNTANTSVNDLSETITTQLYELIRRDKLSMR